MGVLIGTKVKEAEIWIPRFIGQVEQLEGDIDKIVVMYAPSRDKSLSYLKHWQDVSSHKIEIYKDPYLPPVERHGATLMRVKQDIQKLLDESGSTSYFNVDCDLVEIPRDSIPRLLAHDKDIVAGMTWTEGRTPPTFFDTYEYRMDGCRFHPFNPPGMGKTEPFTVDSVSTYYLAKAEVELAGVYKNPYPHIPFCRDLRDKGYSVWVDPTIGATHYDLERIGISHPPLPIALSMAPYIDVEGRKWDASVIGALMYHQSKLEYTNWLIEKRNMSYANSMVFLSTRKLLTASMKVYRDLEFLEASIACVYPWVDRIDIATGPVKKRASEVDGAYWVNGHSVDADRIRESIPDPDNKIKIIDRVWKDKEEIQEKLLEVCQTKWMMFHDADECYTQKAMKAIRDFCEQHPDGDKIYARPKRFYNFWGDLKHVAWSMNPMSPFGEFAVPHPMLIHRDVPGLNFGGFHTTPQDGFGTFFTREEKSYPGRVEVLDDVCVFHMGNALDRQALKAKQEYYRNRGDVQVFEDLLFTGDLPIDMIIGKSRDLIKKRDWPEVLLDHPRFKEKARIRVTRKSPNYKFKWVK